MENDSDNSGVKNGHPEEVGSDEPQPKKQKTDNADISVKLPTSSTSKSNNGDSLLQVNDQDSDHATPFAINQSYTDNLATLKELFNNESSNGKEAKNEFVSENFQVLREPFQVVQLKNFIQEDDNLKKLMNDISDTKLNLINNDLYRLKQSDDLNNDPKFESVCAFFKSTVRPFLQKLTGINLNSKVSLTISRYDQYDYLLCHDDQLENRKIAFILYLTENEWSEKDGGQLELFKCDSDDNQPLEIVKRLNPGWNLFNFFIVQPISYHQVSEVKTSRAPRWTINGWFHTDEVNVVPRNYTFPVISQKRSPFKVGSQFEASYEFLKSWINPYYFDDNVVSSIRESFTDDSQIQLQNFLRPHKYSALASALNNSKLQKYWKRHFRPVLANYQYIPEEILFSSLSNESDEASTIQQSNSSKVPNIIIDALRFFNSEGFFLILANMTNVRLHNMAKKDDEEDDDDDNSNDAPSTSKSPKKKKSDVPDVGCEAKCRGEIRLWQTGSYSLVSSLAPECGEDGVIDTMFFLNTGQPKIVTTNSECIDIDDDEDNEDDANMDDNGDKKEDEDKKDEDKKDEDSEEEATLKASTSSAAKKPSSSSSSDLINLSDEEGISIDDDDETNDSEVINLSDSDSDGEELEAHSSGSVIYIEEEFPRPLLSILPKDNTFNVVYRIRRHQRFMKYISSNNQQAPFNEISYTYYPK